MMTPETAAKYAAAIAAARAETAACDTKANAGATIAGVFAAVATLVFQSIDLAGVVAVLAGIAVTAFTTSATLLVILTIPSGGPARDWLIPGARDPHDELHVLLRIVERKHRSLKWGSVAMITAIVATALTVPGQVI